MPRFCIVLAALWLAVLPAAAAPAEIASAVRAQAPLGEGAVRVLFLTAYDAQFWTDAPGWTMDAPFALRLSYGMGFSTGELVSRTEKEMRHVAPALDAAAIDAYGAQLKKVFPDVRKGDAITALYRPGKPVDFFLNGKPTGSVADAGFAAPFFGIWLSSATSDPGLRAQLLHLR